MNWLFRFVPALWLVACGGPPTAMLHERASFSGTVRVSVETDGTTRRITGDLAFDRATQNYQLTLRRGDVADSLSQLPSGEVRAFRNGVPGAANPADRAALEAVLALVQQPPAVDVAVERWETGYRLVQVGRTTTVEIEAAALGHGSGSRLR